MDGSQGDSTSENRRKGSGKRATSQAESTATGSQPVNAPCGACKFLRRKCISGCIFAPHFGTDQGAARFAAVHKVFGASNVSKLLLHIPANRRHDTVVTISYEAQARLSDPVFGCVSTIIALQQQVASLQEELSVVQTQLINSRLAMANALNNSPSQQQHQQHVAVLQPAYSNTSTASTTNNLININNFSGPNNFEQAIAPSNNFEPIRLCPSGQDEEEEEDEDESRDPVAFTNQIFQPLPEQDNGSNKSVQFNR